MLGSFPPRVYGSEAAIRKVSDISRGKPGSAKPHDGGDLRIGMADRPTDFAATSCYL